MCILKNEEVKFLDKMMKPILPAIEDAIFKKLDMKKGFTVGQFIFMMDAVSVITQEFAFRESIKFLLSLKEEGMIYMDQVNIGVKEVCSLYTGLDPETQQILVKEAIEMSNAFYDELRKPKAKKKTSSGKKVCKKKT